MDYKLIKKGEVTANVIECYFNKSRDFHPFASPKVHFKLNLIK
jgi:hypothetical protein